MSQEEQANLFKPYYRTQNQEKLSKNKGGHGLGLSICKMIA